MSIDECVCVASAASTRTSASLSGTQKITCSDDDTVASTDSPISSQMAAPPMTINLLDKYVVQDPDMDALIARSWPEAATTLKLESLRVNIQLDVVLSAERHEYVLLALAPQLGARMSVGGHSGKDCATRILVHGEQQISLSSSDIVATPPNIMRVTFQESWEEAPNMEGLRRESDSDHGEDSDSDNNNEFSVTGSRSGLAASKITDSKSLVLMGFSTSVQASVTAMLYISSARPDAVDTTHTLVLQATGSLEFSPKLEEMRCLKHSWLLDAAQADAKRNDHVAALQKWRYVIPFLEKQAGTHDRSENARVASTLHSMGIAYNAIGDSASSLGCLRRALAVRQQLHGEEHPDSARTMQAIGVVRTRNGELHEAFEYFWQALQYYEAFAPESLEAATTLQAIAGVYGKLGEYAEAQECYLRALLIRERQLGEDNPEVATTLHNVGVVFEKLGDHNDALESFQRALTIRETRLGQNHLQVARTLHSIGIVYSQLGNHEESLNTYQRALDIFRQLPTDTTDSAATLNNMGVIYAKLGKVEAALEHHHRAAEILEKALGPRHIDTLATKQNIQVLISDSKQSSKKNLGEQLATFFNNALFGADDQTQPFLCLRASHPQKWTQGHAGSMTEVASASVDMNGVTGRVQPSGGCKQCKLSL